MRGLRNKPIVIVYGNAVVSCCASANSSLIVAGNHGLNSVTEGSFQMAKVDSSLVADLPLFAGFSTADLDAILSEARSVRIAKNSSVFQQGEEAHSFFVLLHGHVRASKTTPAGEQIVLRYVTTGETFGVAKAIGLQRYPATATAVDDSVVLAWSSGISAPTGGAISGACHQRTPGSRCTSPGDPYPGGRDVDGAGRKTYRARSVASRQAVRPQGRPWKSKSISRSVVRISPR